MVQPYHEILKPQLRHHVADGGEQLRLDDARRRANRIDIALEELAEPPACGPVGTPDGLNLVPLEELRQLVLVLGDDTRERNREVVTQREIRLAARFVLAALQNLENEPVALFAVLPLQRLDVLEGRRLERFETRNARRRRGRHE